MQTNGTISPAIISHSENEYGEISTSQVMWGTAIHCAIVTNADTRIGKYEDGEFRMSAYKVLIDTTTPFFQAVTDENNAVAVTTEWDAIVVNSKQFNFERVRLTRYDEYLGEFRVQRYNIFPRMGRIELLLAQ